MLQSAHSLREDLYRVVHHYADLSKLAQKGVIDPLAQIGRILNRRFPYLLLVIRDLLPPLERGEMTYFEVLFNIIRAAQVFSDQKALMSSLEELEKIESESRAFIYAVKWLSAVRNQRPTSRDIEKTLKRLVDLNRKYKQRYVPDQKESATFIPSFLERDEGETDEAALARVADLVRRAFLELFRLMVENESSERWFVFSRSPRKEMEDELMELAFFLFRCGFGIDRISSGYYKNQLSDFLHEKLLDMLKADRESIGALLGLSTHLALISLMDFGSFFEHPGDYCDLEDAKTVSRHAKSMKNKHRGGGVRLLKLLELHETYGASAQGRLAKRFLAYRYHAAFGDYHGTRRSRDQRSEAAIELYKPVLDRQALERRTAEDVKESGRFYSSKTREEMSALVRLILDSLENPNKVRGTKVKVLGDISSGAMGNVSVGIFRGKIAALKRVNLVVGQKFGDPEALLNYEAAMHARVQTPVQHPYVVEYFGLVEQDGEKILIGGYHPNDSLTQLVEQNWRKRYKPPLAMESALNLATLEIVVEQLLKCLALFKEKGLVHRDLKTDNVLYMVDEHERLNRIKVIDFGVALAVGPAAMEDIFKGKVVGTFSYMAPEQARGKISFQSDLYSVGVIFAVLLTGKLPLLFPKVETRQELAKQIGRVEREPRPKLASLNPWLTKNPALEQIAKIVDRMLELDPSKRPSLDAVRGAFAEVFRSIGDQKYSISVFYQE